MFAEPLAVTYNASVQNLARVGTENRAGIAKVKGTSTFRTADGQFSVYITESLLGTGMRRFEVILERIQQDSDGPFVGSWLPLPNRFGYVFEINDLRYNTATDLPLLQAAIVDLVDGPFRDRLVAGEK